MKKFFYSVTLLTALSFAANAQTKGMDLLKNKNNFMQRFHQSQNFNSQDQRFSLRINPYWEDVNAPHTYNSYMPQIKVPAYNSVWGILEYDSVSIGKSFVHTSNSGKTWLLDTVEAPANYGLGTISATDDNTCYASMSNFDNGLGGGIFKTADGGYHWHQLAKGKIFDSASYPDFVYFFDARNGLAVGDNNGDTSRLEMYTTSDAGAIWVPVPKANIPPTTGSAYSFNFNVYAALGNRFWFLGYDDQGNGYTYRSDDLGHSWKLFSNTYLGSLYAYAFADKQNGLGVSFDNNGVVYVVATHDGGETWGNKSYKGYPMGGFLTVIPGTHTFVSTLPSGFTPVYGSSYSNDYGATWKIIDSGVTAVHSALQFLNPLVGWTGSAGFPLTSGGAYKWKLQFIFSFKSFIANKTSNNVLLNWNVENDWNNNYYSVERSADGQTFSEVGKVKGIENGSQSNPYNYEDKTALNGIQYYRLKQVDKNGNISYSSIQKVDFGNSTMLLLYPNPAKDVVTVTGLNPLSKTTLSLFNINSKMMQQSTANGESYQLNIQTLSAGSYYIKIQSGEKTTTLKFVKE